MRLISLVVGFVSMLVPGGPVCADDPAAGGSLQRVACHDGVWDPTEWCGRDCWVDVGSTDMTHDCAVELIDFGVLAPQYMVTACGLSGDFDSDCDVDEDDFATFVSRYGEPVSPCIPADSPDAAETAGGLYLSFSYDANNIQSDIEPQATGNVWVYVVAGDIAALSSLEFGVTSTHPEGFAPGFEPAFPFNMSMENGPEDVTVGAVYSTGGPVIVGRFAYDYDGQPQVDFQIVSNSNSGNLRWGAWTQYEYHDFLEAGSAHIYDGGIPTAIAGTAVPRAIYRLDQNHPNPFSPSTSIQFSVPASAHVLLAVYDAAGRRVAVLANEYHDRGEFTEVWDGTDDGGRRVSPGIYFACMEAYGFRAMRKMILLQ